MKCVALRDIPSCSMHNLSQCPDIRSLTLQNCGLLAVEGLDKCKELQELHIKVKIMLTSQTDRSLDIPFPRTLVGKEHNK